jgi:hypothetical protein
VKDPWTGEDPDRGLIAIDGPLAAFLEKATEGRRPGLGMVQGLWPAIVAPPWAERSRPIRLERGELTVEVADGATATRLRMEGNAIRRSLEGHLGRGEVGRIRFRVARPGRLRPGPDGSPKS